MGDQREPNPGRDDGSRSRRRARRRSNGKRRLEPRPSPMSTFVHELKQRQYEWDAEDAARRDPTLLVRHTMRSGQAVKFSGNVVVLGDVNPGAEIHAGGDIIVMGWLRGLAHAGGDSNEKAKVSAFRLDPTQLRVAHHIGRAPDHADAVTPGIPEMAEVRDGRLIIDRWQESVLSAWPSIGER